MYVCMLIFAFSTNSHMQHLAPPKPSVCCGFFPLRMVRDFHLFLLIG